MSYGQLSEQIDFTKCTSDSRQNIYINKSVSQDTYAEEEWGVSPIKIPQFGTATFPPIIIILIITISEFPNNIEHLSSPPVFCGIRVTPYLVLWVMFCRSLFVFFLVVIVLSVLLWIDGL